MTDYQQPEFYRFNEDSLALVKEIVSQGFQPEKILDIGAGSGVIGIELAQKLRIPVVHFLELQKEWAPFLSANIETYLKVSEVKIFWNSVGRWIPETKYDLIVANPPYYLPENGRLSPDPVRARCRSFLEDNWETLFAKSFSALKPHGHAFFVTTPDNLGHVKRAARDLPLRIIEKNNILILRISSE